MPIISNNPEFIPGFIPDFLEPYKGYTPRHLTLKIFWLSWLTQQNKILKKKFAYYAETISFLLTDFLYLNFANEKFEISICLKWTLIG